MTWDAMLDAEQKANDPAWAFESYKRRNPRMLAFNGPVIRSVWADAVKWVVKRIGEWESLTEREAILELRKGEASIFYPKFRDDPKIFADCPRDGRVVIDVQGFCDRCGFDFTR